jgi:circadian clock protein KaiC
MRETKMVKRKTGIKKFDEVTDGIESGSRTILMGPIGTGKTVFAMQFLWTGLQNGETVSYDVMDKPWPRQRQYFKSFGWDIHPYEEAGKFISIQAFTHYAPYPRDPLVMYFSLSDFEEMKRLDEIISRADTTRFVAGDFHEWHFGSLNVEYMVPVETWTVNWSHYDDICNMDIMTTATERNMKIAEATDLDLNVAHNIIEFRLNKETWTREMRIVKMEGTGHPLEWMPFEVTKKGITLF